MKQEPNTDRGLLVLDWVSLGERRKVNCLTGAALAWAYYWPTGRIGVLTGTRHMYVRHPFPAFPHFACFVGKWAIHYSGDVDLPWWKQLHYKGNFRMDQV